eukprot:TRINITY_DN36404_c0_g1_i1.p1 TRINITY_DN36404_c0_g1~~TRINITY_DN36404_c0_g1_i1.p1  ORF type:complete len:577 (+),score=95.58 TRINITY_DN36404_c0_g1_i1:148-1878(+)
MSEWSQVPKRKKPQRKNGQSNVAAQQNAVVGGYFVDSAPKSKAAQKNANRAARRREAALERERQQRLLEQVADDARAQTGPTAPHNTETGSTGGGLPEEWDGLEEALRLSKMEASNTSRPPPPVPVEPVVAAAPAAQARVESVGDMPPAPATDPASQGAWVTIPKKEAPRVTSSAPPPTTNGPVMTKAAKKNAKRKAKREQERLRRQEAEQAQVAAAGGGFSSPRVEPLVPSSQPSYQTQEPELVAPKSHCPSTQDTSVLAQSQIAEDSSPSVEEEGVGSAGYSVPPANPSAAPVVPVVQSSPPHQAPVVAPVNQAPWGLDPSTVGVPPGPAYSPSAVAEPVPPVGVDARNGTDSGYGDEAPLPVPSFLDETAQEEQQRLLEDLQRKRAAMEAELARQQEILELKRATLELQEQQKRVQEQLDQLSQGPKTTSVYNQPPTQTMYQQSADSVAPPGMYNPAFGVPQAKRHPDAAGPPPGIGGQSSYANNNAENEPNGNGSVGTWSAQPRSFGRGGGRPRARQDQQGAFGGPEGGHAVGGLSRVNKTLAGWQEAEQDTSMSDHAGISGSNVYVPPFRR